MDFGIENFFENIFCRAVTSTRLMIPLAISTVHIPKEEQRKTFFSSFTVRTLDDAS